MVRTTYIKAKRALVYHLTLVFSSYDLKYGGLEISKADLRSIKDPSFRL